MFSYLITILAIAFWIFRVAVTFMFTTNIPFAIIPINTTFEIAVLFISFICIILIAKRKMLGAVIYSIVHAAYFGVDAYKCLQTIIEGVPTNTEYVSLFISLIAVLIPIFAIMNIGLSTGKKSSIRNKKTDWFYGTTEYDRNFDDRADKNQYKF